MQNKKMTKEEREKLVKVVTAAGKWLGASIAFGNTDTPESEQALKKMSGELVDAMEDMGMEIS